MTAIQAQAPGKVFLTGEYAVLVGAPALVAAVDRHARVRVEIGAGGGPLRVHSLAESEHQTITDVDAGEIPEGDVGCVVAALRAARANQDALGVAADVVVDTRPFLDGPRKLGLGRSAATLAAAVAAFFAAAGDTDRERVLAAAVSANVLFQEGWGSGGDVAASVHGGVVEVSRRAGDLHATRRELPPGLHLVVGWTRESASTVPLLRRFASAQELCPGGPAALSDLCRVAAEAANAVANGDAASLTDAVDRSADLLQRLGSEVGIPIVTPALARLVRAARGVGAAAKPSGAGGGDCGIALARSPAQVAAVEAAWQAEGITPLALALARDGVTVG